MHTLNAYKHEGPQDSVWQLQAAKARLSELIKNAAVKPQIITVRGAEAAVVLSPEEYRRIEKPEQSFYEFIRNSPLYGTEFEFEERRIEPMREIDL
jgi:prevent-host-death family protein